MLEGITVLNASTACTITGLFGALMLILGGLAVILGICEKWGAFIWTMLMIILIGIAAGCGTPFFVHEEEVYQVLISEEVNFVEFNETYEVISQEGLIYKIKLKEK